MRCPLHAIQTGHDECDVHRKGRKRSGEPFASGAEPAADMRWIFPAQHQHFHPRRIGHLLDLSPGRQKRKEGARKCTLRAGVSGALGRTLRLNRELDRTRKAHEHILVWRHFPPISRGLSVVVYSVFPSIAHAFVRCGHAAAASRALGASHAITHTLGGHGGTRRKRRFISEMRASQHRNLGISGAASADSPSADRSGRVRE